MASAREMQLRMRSVDNISQVTRALEAVSASKVRQSQQSVQASRDYSSRVLQVLHRLAPQDGSQQLHPLLTERESITKIELLLITSDRGLAGAYNMNITRLALDFLRQRKVPVQWVTVGHKGRDLVRRSGAKITADFASFRRSPEFTDVTPIARTLLDDFLSGSVDEVYLAYTDFVNTLRQIPRVKRLLPLSPPEVSEHTVDGEEHSEVGTGQFEYIYEPESVELLEAVLPRFTQVQVFQAVLESLASEHSARMVAMRNATDNANELSNRLRLAYNKARQLAVTSDLLDIAGGAEALQSA